MRSMTRNVASSRSGFFAMAEPLSPFQLDFDPRSLPPDFLKAIGLVTVATGQTENQIEELITGCLGVDFEYGMAVTLHMAMPQRFSAVRAAAEIRLDDLDALDTLDDLVDRAEKAFEARNSIVHHQFGFERRTGRVFLVKESARKRVESDVVEITLDQINATAKEMYDVGIDLYNFAKKHSLLATFPPGPRPRQHKSRAARKKRREALLRAAAVNPSEKLR